MRKGKRNKRGAKKWGLLMFFFNYMVWQYKKSGALGTINMPHLPLHLNTVSPCLHESFGIFPSATVRHTFLMAPKYML